MEECGLDVPTQYGIMGVYHDSPEIFNLKEWQEILETIRVIETLWYALDIHECGYICDGRQRRTRDKTFHSAHNGYMRILRKHDLV